ncbi:MAG: hypothetical protein LBN04_11130 [Oscillospiraceae bacterium]|jgi:hypothetical protein|nr:hypothetical protein [Oscillospiraceae bacterium]
MMYLYHYYDAATGPFMNLSDLTPDEAEAVQAELARQGKGFAAQRDAGYLARRRELEQLARRLFIAKGGRPVRNVPHYMVVGECPWLATWYADGRFVKIPIEAFDLRTVSFTYGDMFPTFSPQVADGAEYRGQVYTYEEILRVIAKYGLPQERWTGAFGQAAYVEAQVWGDEWRKGLVLS